MITESQSTEGGLPFLHWRGFTLQKGGMPMYVTYSDLIQIGIFIVSLIGLMYEIFKDKK